MNEKYIEDKKDDLFLDGLIFGLLIIIIIIMCLNTYYLSSPEIVANNVTVALM